MTLDLQRPREQHTPPHYIVCGLRDVALTPERAAGLEARGLIYAVPGQPIDGRRSYYVHGKDDADDQRLLALIEAEITPTPTTPGGVEK